MSFQDEILCPRLFNSLFWIILLQECIISIVVLLLKIISFHPVSSFIEWLFSMIHYKSLFYMFALALCTVGFGILNTQFSSVEKHLCSSRFEKLLKSLSLYSIRYVSTIAVLGGLTVFCLLGIFQNCNGVSSLLDTCFLVKNNFEYIFVVCHGCYTGVMFSLKYFIYNLYLIKFNLHQESKLEHIKRKASYLIKESFICVLKAVHWYYISFILCGFLFKFLSVSVNGEHNSIYRIVNPILALITISTGVITSLVWSLYLELFNSFMSEHHIFPIQVPINGDKSKTLSCALTCSDSYIKYLAVLDLRHLSQHDAARRGKIFAISHPGGHPHEWKTISGICIKYLQEFVYKLYEYSVSTVTTDSKALPAKIPKVILPKIDCVVETSSAKILSYFREKPVFSYFLDEYPNAKLMKLFNSSQLVIWIIDALGYLISASYEEDKFGVVQQSLPDIICLLLDIKMAEEKMPVGLVGICTYVKDPQGRYEHIHQRLSLKTTVNSVLCRIATTFKEDINGINLPDEYQKYFMRYLTRKNV